MRIGTVKSIIAERGFGFISERGGADYFFHVTDLNDLEFNEQLRGRRVEFEVERGRDGRVKCSWVRPAE